MSPFDSPSGYLADRVGDRRSRRVSTALLMAGGLVYTGAESFWTVAMAETVLSAGAELEIVQFVGGG